MISAMQPRTQGLISAPASGGAPSKVPGYEVECYAVIWKLLYIPTTELYLSLHFDTKLPLLQTSCISACVLKLLCIIYMAVR